MKKREETHPQPAENYKHYLCKLLKLYIIYELFVMKFVKSTPGRIAILPQF